MHPVVGKSQWWFANRVPERWRLLLELVHFWAYTSSKLLIGLYHHLFGWHLSGKESYVLAISKVYGG